MPQQWESVRLSCGNHERHESHERDATYSRFFFRVLHAFHGCSLPSDNSETIELPIDPSAASVAVTAITTCLSNVTTNAGSTIAQACAMQIAAALSLQSCSDRREPLFVDALDQCGGRIFLADRRIKSRLPLAECLSCRRDAPQPDRGHVIADRHR
jgi:hypothetical protein